jgi:hypothetical protein
MRTIGVLVLAACSASGARAPTSPCAAAIGTSGEWRDGADRTTVRVTADVACRRTYELSTTAPLRDHLPVNPRTVEEPADGPIVRTNNVTFDALYALALAEAREASVASIHDAGFDNGKPRRCPCFETGRLWTYVWTRDTAYSTDLGLATLDPIRAMRSLEFKLSGRRGGGHEQIVQDTGSGGSWPISTDRVVWALGARALLRTLDGDDRQRFADRAYEALANTIELDRAVAFDARDGLYTGETSFLDWREQTYPAWTATDTVHIGMSKALSTNALHANALDVAAELAQEHGDGVRAARWRGWAVDLRAAIRAKFWLADRGAFAAFTPTFLDPAPSARRDLLATSLAVLLDVADAKQARAAIAEYPQLPDGPPVVWPPVRDVPVYHNRASWPFVTAYELRAARRVRNDRVAALAIESLVRGAASNLSNMENFEMLSGRSQTPDGPVVDSQRQLWSVAGYLAMVQDVVFGIEPTGSGVRFAPYIPKAVRESLFRDASSIVLDGYRYRGRRLTVTVHLPPGGGAGAYEVGNVRVDGRAVPGGEVPDAQLATSARVDIELVDRAEPASAMRLVDASGPVYGPDAPTLSVELIAGGARIAYSASLPVDIYRDGVRVATALAPDARTWIDRGVDLATRSACWSAETVDARTGDVSHRSRPVCLFGEHGERVQTIGAQTLGTITTGPRPYVAGPIDTEARAAYSGDHLVSLVAANGSGPINTGVTCGVKHVTITHVPDGAVVGEGHVLVPHGGSWDDWRESSFVRARLVAKERYRIRIDDAPTALNMSAFEHFSHYTGGAGGVAGALDQIHVAELRVIAL